MKRIVISLLCAMAIAVVLTGAGHDQVTEETSILLIDHKAIQYGGAPLRDPVTNLDRDLAAGKTELEWSPQYGWLPSILKHLDLNVDSQMLVFSKTSFQASKNWASRAAGAVLQRSSDGGLGAGRRRLGVGLARSQTRLHLPYLGR